MKPWIGLILLLLLAAACAPLTGPLPTATVAPPAPTQPAATVTSLPPTPASTGSVITPQLLENFTYVLSASGGIQVTLVDGAFQVSDPANNLFASGQLVKAAYGDLNGDGTEDAAVIIAINLGGSGTFHDLIAVLDQGGQAVQAADLFVGDRIQERQLSIADGQITLDMTRQGPNDPMCCPSQHASVVYQLKDNALTVVSDQVQPPEITPTQADLPNRITIDLPQAGAAVSHEVVLRGATAQMPFEKNLVVRAYDASGNIVAEMPVMVQGDYGSPGTFETQVQLPADLHGNARLEVVDIDMASGQPRGLASVTVTVQ